MDDSPYRSPQAKQPRPIGSGHRPSVVLWYKVYVSCLALMYLAILTLGLLLVVFAEQITAGDPNQEAFEARIFGSMMVVMGAALTLGTIVGLLAPRKKWGWIYGMVLICLGLTSCGTLVPSIALLIFWLKPETKAFYDMQS